MITKGSSHRVMITGGSEEQLIAFVKATKWNDISSDVKTVVLRSVADTLGLCVRAAWLPESSPVITAALELAGTPPLQGIVIGRTERPGRLYAALLNGFFAHSMDFDDTNSEAFVHPSATPLAVAMALADQDGISGSDLLRAIALGIEVCCRVGAALGRATYERGFHPTAIAGVVGGVITAGELLGLSESATSDALGLASGSAAGSMQYLSNGSWNKRLHPGLMAQMSLQAATLAKHGVRGAAAPLTGSYGLLQNYSPESRVEMLTDGLGTTWKTIRTAIKPYPSCRLTHGAIDAARAAWADPKLDVDAVKSITVSLPPEALPIVARSDDATVRPSSIVDAQFSVFAQVAFALTEGTVTWESYGRMGSSRVRELIDCMVAVPDTSIPRAGGALELSTSQGLRSEYACDQPRGSAEIPLTASDLRAKFNALAEPVLGTAKSARLWEEVRMLPSSESLGQLIEACTPNELPHTGGSE